MTKRVRSRKSEAGSFVFWLQPSQPNLLRRSKLGLITLFTFALLFLCTTLLVGCTSQGVAGSGKVKRIPAEQKKAALLKTVDRKFENPQAHYELGQLYHGERLWTKAEYHYNVALRFDPAHSEAQAAMVKVFLDSRDTAKAKTYADIYMNQIAGSASGAFRLGLAFQKQLLDEYAFDCYQQALHMAPNSARIHRQLGYYYLSKNDKVRGEEYLKRSFQLDPVQPDVAGELGRLGIAVRIPPKTKKRTKKIDKIAEESR